jgi:predicted house-cleaning noncanonical NTP pyrophosphatase (MazG superfamily)
MEQRIGKIVRDLVPDKIREDGRIPVVHVLDSAHFGIQIRNKLVEEASELANADTHETIVAELADVVEVVEAIQSALGITPEQINLAKEEKAEQLGTFKKRIFLDSIKSNE